MTEEERLDYVTGRSHALMGAVMVLIRLHPEPMRLAAEMEAMSITGQAKSEATNLSDVFLEGFGDMMKLLRGAAAKRAGPASPPRRNRP